MEYSQELLPLLHSFPTCEDIGLLKSENQVVCKTGYGNFNLPKKLNLLNN